MVTGLTFSKDIEVPFEFATAKRPREPKGNGLTGVVAPGTNPVFK